MEFQALKDQTEWHGGDGTTGNLSLDQLDPLGKLVLVSHQPLFIQVLRLWEVATNTLQ